MRLTGRKTLRYGHLVCEKKNAVTRTCAPNAYENSRSLNGNVSYPQPSPESSPDCERRFFNFPSVPTKQPGVLCSTADMTFSSLPLRPLLLPKIHNTSVLFLSLISELPSLPLSAFPSPPTFPTKLPKNMSVPNSVSMLRKTLPCFPMTYATQSGGTSTTERSVRGVDTSTVIAPSRCARTHAT